MSVSLSVCQCSVSVSVSVSVYACECQCSVSVTVSVSVSVSDRKTPRQCLLTDLVYAAAVKAVSAGRWRSPSVRNHSPGQPLRLSSTASGTPPDRVRQDSLGHLVRGSRLTASGTPPDRVRRRSQGHLVRGSRLPVVRSGQSGKRTDTHTDRISQLQYMSIYGKKNETAMNSHCFMDTVSNGITVEGITI